MKFGIWILLLFVSACGTPSLYLRDVPGAALVGRGNKTCLQLDPYVDGTRACKVEYGGEAQTCWMEFLPTKFSPTFTRHYLPCSEWESLGNIKIPQEK